MPNKLIVQYEGLGFSHVRLNENITCVTVEWGQLIDLNEWNLTKPTFDVKATQTFNYDDYPELRDMHDGYGWNLYDVLVFVESLALK